MIFTLALLTREDADAHNNTSEKIVNTLTVMKQMVIVRHNEVMKQLG